MAKKFDPTTRIAASFEQKHVLETNDRSKIIETFIAARAAFLTHNKHDLEIYMTELSKAAAAKALDSLSAEMDIAQVGRREIEQVTGYAAASAIAHITLHDLPPSFFVTEPYFTLRKATKTRTAVVEAAKALIGGAA